MAVRANTQVAVVYFYTEHLLPKVCDGSVSQDTRWLIFMLILYNMNSPNSLLSTLPMVLKAIEYLHFFVLRLYIPYVVSFSDVLATSAYVKHSPPKRAFSWPGFPFPIRLLECSRQEALTTGCTTLLTL